MTLLLRAGGACHFDAGDLLNVFGAQRQRFVTALQGFGPDDWAAPTRCTDWSAHDVIRHLCDSNAIIKAWVTGTGYSMHDMSAGYDPRTTPREQLTASVRETPGATCSRFVATTEELLSLARSRLAQDLAFNIRLPYGPMDWTVGLLHGFWESWLHERDVLLPMGREYLTDDDATVYATAYGVFIAAAVASIFFGEQVQDKLELSGDGGGVFDLDSRDGVTLTVTRVTTAGPPAAEVTDALAGRSRVAATLGDLAASSRTALSRLGDFFNTPVEPNPS